MHLTSSAKISSCGLVLIVASSDSSSVLVGLLGVGLLGVLADEDLAVEDAVGLAVEDALVQLVAGAVRLGVVDDRVVVDVLRAVGQVEAVERALAAFAVEDAR